MKKFVFSLSLLMLILFANGVFASNTDYKQSENIVDETEKPIDDEYTILETDNEIIIIIDGKKIVIIKKKNN